MTVMFASSFELHIVLQSWNESSWERYSVIFHHADNDKLTSLLTLASSDKTSLNADMGTKNMMMVTVYKNQVRV